MKKFVGLFARISHLYCDCRYEGRTSQAPQKNCGSESLEVAGEKHYEHLTPVASKAGSTPEIAVIQTSGILAGLSQFAMTMSLQSDLQRSTGGFDTMMPRIAESEHVVGL